MTVKIIALLDVIYIPETTYAIFEVNCNEDHDLQIYKDIRFIII